MGTALCAYEWGRFLDDSEAFSAVLPSKTQGLYFIVLSDCVMIFNALDYDEILEIWKAIDQYL